MYTRIFYIYTIYIYIIYNLYTYTNLITRLREFIREKFDVNTRLIALGFQEQLTTEAYGVGAGGLLEQLVVGVQRG